MKIQRLALIVTLASTVLAGGQSKANVCDYRPSRVLSPVGAAVLGSTTAVLASSGPILEHQGYYRFIHSSGRAMLGSTAEGLSAAGTRGIIAGSSGALGSTAAFLMQPWVWIPVAAITLGGGAFETACVVLSD